MPWLTNRSFRARVYVGMSLRQGSESLEELSRFFHTAGFEVYMPYDDDTRVTPTRIKAMDMEALRTSDVAVLVLNEISLGVAQELGAARALNRPVILIASSNRVTSHNWVRGDPGITCCETREEALSLLKSMKTT